VSNQSPVLLMTALIQSYHLCVHWTMMIHSKG
jgi:hypothetical protein